MAIYAIILTVIFLALKHVIKRIARFDDHFTSKWAVKTEDGRLLRIVVLRRPVVRFQKLVECLRWFGYRLADNQELLCLLKDSDCPMGVWGYNQSSREFIQTDASLGSNTKSLSRYECPFKITRETRIAIIRIPKVQSGETLPLRSSLQTEAP
ncbi:MAG TPA: hypothetical protein VMR73_00840 [Candidatus Paceibacterota bacterium]|nr:hypothetical protein [Candidatus Paceibacterota bacterium]